MKEYDNSVFILIVNEKIHSKRDRNILIDRYVNGLLFKELEDKYGLTDRHIKRICYKGFDCISSYI